MDLNRRCRRLRSRESRGATRGEGRARLRKVQDITDARNGNVPSEMGQRANENPLDNLEARGLRRATTWTRDTTESAHWGLVRDILDAYQRVAVIRERDEPDASKVIPRQSRNLRDLAKLTESLNHGSNMRTNRE